MHICVKKIALIPVGDQEEKNRIYKYIRDGMYSQYRILNTYMSQLGTLYYLHNRDISNPKYKNRVRKIFRNTNTAIFDIDQPTGLGMAGSCGMRVKKDFNIAIKNGLAKGERQIPYYKRNYPLMIPSRLFSIYASADINNEETEYFIKFPNKIFFKIYLGSKGRRDKQLISILEKICNPDNSTIKTCDSTVAIEKSKIILNLSYKMTKEESVYRPIQGRIMGVAFGYNHPCITYIPEIDKIIKLGVRYSSEMIKRRIKIQNKRRDLSILVRFSHGGRGRKLKLKTLDRFHNYEKNVRNYYNHLMSKDIVECARKNSVDLILLEKISGSDSDTTPFIHRNWSIYSLISQIKYKAKKCGIEVKEIPSDSIVAICSNCGSDLDIDIPRDMIWVDSITVSCPCCKGTIDFYENKAKNLTSNLNKIK